MRLSGIYFGTSFHTTHILRIIKLFLKVNETDLSRRARSKIRVSSDPESYIDRLQRERKKKDEKRMQQLEVKRAQEEETCTFQPETRGCPEFIKVTPEFMGSLFGGGLFD